MGGGGLSGVWFGAGCSQKGEYVRPSIAYEAAVAAQGKSRSDGELLEGGGSPVVCQLPRSHVPSEVNNQRGTN